MLATDPLADCRVDVSAVGGAGELAAVLARHGIALFHDVHREDGLLQLGHRLGQIVPHRDRAQSGITMIADQGRPVPRPSGAGFTNQALAPHTDASDRPRPPLLVLMACVRPAERGGEAMLVDGRAVHTELATTAPDALADLSAARGAYFGGAAGTTGNVFEPRPDGLVGIRLRLDELARFSPSASRSLPLLRRVLERHIIVVKLPTGGGYVVNNRRWLHGRTAFTGPRLMRRVLLHPHPTWRIPPGFTPQ